MQKFAHMHKYRKKTVPKIFFETLFAILNYMPMPSIASIPQILELPKILDERGNLSFLESQVHVPFKIKRCYWIYDVPGGEFRGSHAFKEQHELIIALSGSFDAVIHDGVTEKRFSLSRSYYGLYLPPLSWRQLDNFSTNSLALVLSSHFYDEEDYVWDFEDFLRVKQK